MAAGTVCNGVPHRVSTALVPGDGRRLAGRAVAVQWLAFKTCSAGQYSYDSFCSYGSATSPRSVMTALAASGSPPKSVDCRMSALALRTVCHVAPHKHTRTSRVNAFCKQHQAVVRCSGVGDDGAQAWPVEQRPEASQHRAQLVDLLLWHTKRLQAERRLELRHVEVGAGALLHGEGCLAGEQPHTRSAAALARAPRADDCRQPSGVRLGRTEAGGARGG